MQIIDLDLSPKVAFDEHLLRAHLIEYLHLQDSSHLRYKLIKRSLDARKKPLISKLRIAIYESYEEEQIALSKSLKLKPIDTTAHTKSLVIVGAGPAGLFAALRALSLGIKPIVIERGEDVRSRRKALANLNRDGLVNPESNYCFGEGGAGTYSDGKLYTRSKKRGSVRAILELLVSYGAPGNIVFEAHPHIGTNRLPKVIQEIREHIRHLGGEVHFNTKVVDFVISSHQSSRSLRGVILADGREIISDLGVILATGHSARDIFTLLAEKEIKIEAKPFALGVRVEHRQDLIDQIQYHGHRPIELGSAAYKLVAQVKDRGVFSFCMCPGGIIAPASTAPGEVVVNGWSPYERNGRFANSGIVVSVDQKDFLPFQQGNDDPLAGMRFQAHVEQKAFKYGGSQGVTAPAQSLLDFIHRRERDDLPECSYLPGLKAAPLRSVLPSSVEKRLRLGFKEFGKRLKGYLSPEAVVVGVESRTSSPIKIPRDRESCEHPELSGLFPCGEGAGYAGGIISAALDGFRCVEAAHKVNRCYSEDQWAEILMDYMKYKGGIGS